MKSLFTIALLLLTCSPSFGQVKEKSTQPASGEASGKTSEGQVDSKFETYCLQNATRVIAVPESKAINLKISGEVALLGNTATYRDYQVALKENETQYFTITGTNQLLAVSSVYRLRVAYNAEKH